MENKTFLGLGEKWHLQQTKKTINDIQNRIEKTEHDSIELYILHNRLDQISVLLDECHTLFDDIDLNDVMKDIDQELFKEVYTLGVDVFSSQENFIKWLGIENLGLGKVKPLELFDSNDGLKKVLNSLKIIDRGGFG